MKRKILCMAMIIMVLLSRSECFANESTDVGVNTLVDSDSEETQAPVVSENHLLIDDNNVYEGMDMSYQQGYEPLVADGKAVVILPVYEANETAITSIRAVPHLGTAENTPFIYKNYQKTVGKTEQIINGSQEKKEVFLVRFDFQLQSDRYNGVYPVEITLSYEENSISTSQVYTVYIRITDGRSIEEEETTPVTEARVEEETEADPTSEPKVIVTKSEQSPERIVSGSDFTINVVLKNTNKLKYVQNITVTVSCEAEGIALLEDSNVFYYEYLAGENTLELPLRFRANEKTAEGKYSVNLTISYDNPDAVSLSTTGKIDFNVHQDIRVSFEAGAIASEINAGDSLSIPIQAMNLGRGSVYNVRCSIEAPGLSTGTSLFLGNIEGGTSTDGELTIFAGMKNENAESEEERYGRTSGKIILTYEDEEGNIYTLEQDIVTTINALTIDNAMNQKTQEEEQGIGSQLIIGIIIVCVVILIGTAVPLFISWKRKRSGDGVEGML